MRNVRIFGAAILAVGLAAAIAASDPWPDSLDKTIRSKTWNADQLSTDPNECDAAVEVIISGNGFWEVDCPMATAEIDGDIFGQWVLPDGFVKSEPLFFEINVRVQDDQGAQTLHGVVNVKCQSNQDILTGTWPGPGAQLDVVAAAADVVSDLLQFSTLALDVSSGGQECDPGDLLSWRFKVCDTDATPSSGCTTSAGAEADFGFLQMKMKYTQSASGD